MTKKVCFTKQKYTKVFPDVEEICNLTSVRRQKTELRYKESNVLRDDVCLAKTNTNVTTWSKTAMKTCFSSKLL